MCTCCQRSIRVLALGPTGLNVSMNSDASIFRSLGNAKKQYDLSEMERNMEIQHGGHGLECIGQ